MALEEYIEPEEQLNVRQNINLNLSNLKVEKKKKIHVYMNEREANINYDTMSASQKEPIDSDSYTDTSGEYKVMRASGYRSERSNIEAPIN